MDGQACALGQETGGCGGEGVQVGDGNLSVGPWGERIGGVVGDGDVAVAVASNLEVEPIVWRRRCQCMAVAVPCVVRRPIEFKSVDTWLRDEHILGRGSDADTLAKQSSPAVEAEGGRKSYIVVDYYLHDVVAGVGVGESIGLCAFGEWGNIVQGGTAAVDIAAHSAVHFIIGKRNALLVGPCAGEIRVGDGKASEAEAAARSGQRECGEVVYLDIGEGYLDFAPVTRYVMQGAGVCTCGGENDVGGDAIAGADSVDCPIGKVLVGIEAVVVRHSVELDMDVGAEWT